MVDNLIHQIDECCWLMDDWPVSCHGMGGREVGSDDHGQNIDTYSMEFTFPNGKKAFCGFRRALEGPQRVRHVRPLRSKKAGQFSGNVHKATVHMFKDQRIAKDNIAWSPDARRRQPVGLRVDRLHRQHPQRQAPQRSQAGRLCRLRLADGPGRRPLPTRSSPGTRSPSLEFQFCDYLDDLDYDSPPPVKADEEGYFPAPHAGNVEGAVTGRKNRLGYARARRQFWAFGLRTQFSES